MQIWRPNLAGANTYVRLCSQSARTLYLRLALQFSCRAWMQFTAEIQRTAPEARQWAGQGAQGGAGEELSAAEPQTVEER